jgi:polygalacturonase
MSGAAPAYAQNFSGSVNVRDYGVTGDGVTDDTEAIQRIFVEAGKYKDGYLTQVYGSSHAEIYFPAGTYRISAKVNLGHYISVRGEAGAVILQTDPREDLFNFKGYRARFDGLTFEGGRRALVYDPENLDTSYTYIHNCKFTNQTGYAIDVEGISSVLHIQNADFDNCMGVLNTNNDVAVLENARITTNPHMRGAVVKAAKMLMMENVVGRGRATEGAEQVWIDYGGCNLALRNVTLASVSGPGMVPIYSRRKYSSAYTGIHICIIVEDSCFDASRNPKKAVMYLEEFPNMISIRNTRESTDTSANLLDFATVPNAGYFQFSRYGLAFTFCENRCLTANVPASMRPYVRNALPAHVDEFIESMLIRDKEGLLSPASFTPPRRLNVLDFGAQRGTHFDNTSAFRAAFKTAADTPGTEVIFPSGYYRVTDTITLPDEVMVRGVAKAVIAMDGNDKDIFVAKSARNIAVIGINFLHGRGSLRLQVEPEYAGKILVNYCQFEGNAGSAVTAVSGDYHVQNNPAAKLRISDCMFLDNHQVLVSNLNVLQDSTWVTAKIWTEGDAEEFPAVFENKGLLRIQNFCGVPMQGPNARWIDNYSNLCVDFARFGGEFGGIPVLITRKEGDNISRAVIQNGWLYSHAASAPILVKQMPDLLALRNNMGVEDINLQPTYIIFDETARDVIDSVIFNSSNTRPENMTFPKRE